MLFDFLQKMEPSSVRLIFDVALLVIMIGVPFVVVVYPQIPRGIFSLRRRMLIACLVGWVLIIGYQYFDQRYDKLHPIDDELRTDLGDGLVFFLGWLFILLGSLPSLVVCAADDFRRKRGLSGLVKPFKNGSAESGPGE